MADIGEEQKIAVPVMQTLAKIDSRTMKRVDERSFHETGFIDRSARRVIRARRPLDHPVKDLELAELRLPWRNTFCAQIIHKRLLAGSRAYIRSGRRRFIKQVPFLLEAVESAGGFSLMACSRASMYLSANFWGT